MNRIFLIPVTVFALFFVGCTGNGSKVEGEHMHEAEADVPHLETEGHQAGLIRLSDEVKLDNGERWVANPETTDGIHHMLDLVKKGESENSIDYKALKENLDKEFNTVLEKCTMTGESHDQLHVYLLPLKAKFDKLNSNSNKEEVEDIKNYLLTYHDYFK